MATVKDLLATLSLYANSIQDTLVCISGFYFAPGQYYDRISQKLIVIGSIVETARRALISAWTGFVDCLYLRSSFEVSCLTEAQLLAFYLTAQFKDCSYDW